MHRVRHALALLIIAALTWGGAIAAADACAKAAAVMTMQGGACDGCDDTGKSSDCTNLMCITPCGGQPMGPTGPQTAVAGLHNSSLPGLLPGSAVAMRPIRPALPPPR